MIVNKILNQIRIDNKKLGLANSGEGIGKRKIKITYMKSMMPVLTLSFSAVKYYCAF